MSWENSPEGIEYYRLWKVRDKLNKESDKVSDQMASIIQKYWDREKPLKNII